MQNSPSEEIDKLVKFLRAEWLLMPDIESEDSITLGAAIFDIEYIKKFCSTQGWDDNVITIYARTIKRVRSVLDIGDLSAY